MAGQVPPRRPTAEPSSERQPARADGPKAAEASKPAVEPDRGEPPPPPEESVPVDVAREPDAPEDLLAHLDHYVAPPMKKIGSMKWAVFDQLPLRSTVRYCVAKDGRTEKVRGAWARDDVLTVRTLLVATVKRWRFDPVVAGRCGEAVFHGRSSTRWLTIRGPGDRVSRTLSWSARVHREARTESQLTDPRS